MSRTSPRAESGTRAANGRSSIYQGRDGRWYGRVSMGVNADGSPDRRKRSGTTQDEVARKVAQLEADRSAGKATTPGRPPTVAQWLTHWLDTIVVLRVTGSSWDGYESDVRLYAIPGLGQHRLDRVTTEHVEALYAALLRRGKSPAVIHHLRRTLRAAFNDAIARERMSRNPVLHAAVPKLHQTEIEPFTVAEARQILAAAETERNGAAWVIAISLGLRRGEVLNLVWQDIDLEAGTLRVRRQLQRRSWRHGCPDPRTCAAPHHRSACSTNCRRHTRLVRGCPPACPTGCTGHARMCPDRTGGGLISTPPKSVAGRRPVMLPEPLIRVLRAHRKMQTAERLRAGTTWQDLDLVFCQENGRPIDPDGHTKAWNKFLNTAGVRRARLHDARHYADGCVMRPAGPGRVAASGFAVSLSA